MASKSGLTPEQRHLCKRVLRSYPLLKCELAQLEAERESIAEALPPGIVQRSPRRGGDRKADPTAVKACKLVQAEAGHSKARECVAAVDDLLRLLSSEDKKIIRMVYFQGQPCHKVAKAVFMSERTVWYRRNRALELLARLL